MRVFLDTNVLFSGIYSPHGAPATIINAITAGRIALVTSVDIIVELTRNVRDKAPYLLPVLGEFFVDAKPEFASPPEGEILRFEEAEFGSDAAIMAAVVAAQVDYFCTGDRRFRLRAAETGQVRVVTPRELASLLENLSSA